MKVTRTAIPEVLLIEPKVFGDARGFFFESTNPSHFAELSWQDVGFAQDIHCRFAKSVLCGLCCQIQHAQGKLVRETHGEECFP